MNRYGFTLAELLISLAILGVIATFAIPKVLNAQQDGRYNSVAKEAAAAVSEAYQNYQRSSVPDADTKFEDISPYLNYVKLITSGLDVDYQQGSSSANSCTDARFCLLLHNGAVLKDTAQTFGGTDNTSAIRFYVDPDAQHDPDPNGPAKSVRFFLYYNGRLTSNGYILANTCDSGGCYNPDPNDDPPWFSWD